MGTLSTILSYTHTNMKNFPKLIGSKEFITGVLAALLIVVPVAFLARQLKTVTVVEAAETTLAQNAADILRCSGSILPMKEQNEKVLTDNGMTFDYASQKAVKSPF